MERAGREASGREQRKAQFKEKDSKTGATKCAAYGSYRGFREALSSLL